MQPGLTSKFLIEVLERYNLKGHDEGVIPVSWMQLQDSGYLNAHRFLAAVSIQSRIYGVRLKMEWRPDVYTNKPRTLFAYRLLEVV